jgi:hypothetical protein
MKGVLSFEFQVQKNHRDTIFSLHDIHDPTTSQRYFTLFFFSSAGTIFSPSLGQGLVFQKLKSLSSCSINNRHEHEPEPFTACPQKNLKWPFFFCAYRYRYDVMAFVHICLNHQREWGETEWVLMTREPGPDQSLMNFLQSTLSYPKNENNSKRR